jgi:hypothetical protein
VQPAEIRKRLQTLRAEISELRAANEKYLKKHLHPAWEVHAHRQRELRLQEIVDELAALAKRKID